jgi:hypothetical protein
MLTGAPPHRDEKITTEIDKATNLGERLDRYRSAIRNARVPTRHRRVHGVDRALADIVERCLEPDPKQRFANAQEVLAALHARNEARTRKPFILLGIVGPVLLLLVMALFGWRGYLEARDQSTEAIRRRAYESNAFAAKFVARTLESEIERYFQIVEREAKDVQLLSKLNAIDDCKSLEQLHALEPNSPESAQSRQAFLDSPDRKPLVEYLRQRLDVYLERLAGDPLAPKFASLFVVDARGIILSVAYDDRQVDTKSEGLNFAWRTYFHGGPEDLPDHNKRPPDIEPIRVTHLSSVFQSTTTKLWKVAISTPMYDPQSDDRRFLGVLVFTINVGDFVVLRSDMESAADRFPVLVDGREQASSYGTILQHPMFTRRGPDGPPPDYSQKKYRVTAEQFAQLAANWQYRYVDPLGTAVENGAVPNGWIAALEHVRLPDRDGGSAGSERDTGLVIVVQENEQAATAPVRTLGGRLVYEGLLALSVVIAVVFVLWYFVLGVITKPRRTAASSSATEYPPTPIHEMATVTSRKTS